MSEISKKYILTAFRGLMRPIIRIAVKNGLMYREFIQICKMLYVDVAASEYGIAGRQTNTSRVALLTGLDRKEVKRVRELLNSEEDMSIPGQHVPDRVSRVLSAWHHDVKFLKKDKTPRDLPIDGGEVSFAGLVRAYGSDVAAVTLLKELSRTGVVEEIKPGVVRAVKSFYIPSSADLGAMQRICRVIGDISDTLYHNLYIEDDSKTFRFERSATNLHVRSDCVDAFNQYVAQRGQVFLEEIDAWLSVHEVSDAETTNVEVSRLGLGVYWIEGERFAEAA